MSDYYLTKFWKNVKDSSWPNVETWDDFININDSIKKECYNVHGLQDRLDVIENVEYWQARAIAQFQKDQFLFINVPKCGSAHYYDFFRNRLDWQPMPVNNMDDIKRHVNFGLMMHPLDRYLKGLTQFIWEHDLTDHINLERFVTDCVIPDWHSMPYSLMFGTHMNNIHWIPYSSMTAQQTKSCMNALFKLYESEISIPLDHPVLHESPPKKQQLFKQILKIWQSRQEPTFHKPLCKNNDNNSNLYLIYQLYAKDLQFYRQLITNFKPDWSHIKGKLSN